ncbi:MAG TPA: O-antigen polymerase [Bryobacteraceae bacterium]|jgi:oligosaccharide repeat unit polymerase
MQLLKPSAEKPARSRRERFNWILLACLISATGSLIFFANNYWALVAGLAAICLVPALLVRFDILHPYTWYLPLYLLYSASVPTLAAMGAWPYGGSIAEAVRAEWLAACAFVIFVGPARRNPRFDNRAVLSLQSPSWAVYLASLALTVVFLGGILAGGFSSKMEIARSDAIFLRLDPAFSILALAYAILLANGFARGRSRWPFALFTIGWNLLALGICGERDYVLRILWITIYVTHVFHARLDPKKLLAGALILLALIPAMGDLKSVFMSHESNVVNVNQPLQRLLTDEFLTASDNLTLLIRDPAWPRLYGQTLLWDLEQSLLSGSLFPHSSGVAPTLKFNQYYFPDIVATGGARGFTLVGEGYMNFGLAGAGIWYAILGGFVGFLYRRASTSSLWMLGYIVGMPLTIYLTRTDFSNLIAQFGKHIALPLALIFLARQAPKRAGWSRPSVSVA